jgi:uncharacterized protein YndB with AHSA1/START domain
LKAIWKKLKKMENNSKELTISHYFDAPRELVFEAWTNPQQLVQWYAPDGCTIEFKHIDLYKGGTFHSCIHDPVHGECWITGTYIEIKYPELLVFTMVLSDEQGSSVEALAAGKPEAWPKEIITTVAFEAIKDQTKLTLHQTVSEAEAKQTGAYQSWLKMFRRLEGIAIKVLPTNE